MEHVAGTSGESCCAATQNLDVRCETCGLFQSEDVERNIWEQHGFNAFNANLGSMKFVKDWTMTMTQLHLSALRALTVTRHELMMAIPAMHNFAAQEDVFLVLSNF